MNVEGNDDRRLSLEQAIASPTSTPRETSYERDASGRITEVHDPLGGTTTLSYDEEGRLSSRSFPNGITTSYTYDMRGRVETVTRRRPDTSVMLASRQIIELGMLDIDQRCCTTSHDPP